MTVAWQAEMEGCETGVQATANQLKVGNTCLVDSTAQASPPVWGYEESEGVFFIFASLHSFHVNTMYLI